MIVFQIMDDVKRQVTESLRQGLFRKPVHPLPPAVAQ